MRIHLLLLSASYLKCAFQLLFYEICLGTGDIDETIENYGHASCRRIAGVPLENQQVQNGQFIIKNFYMKRLQKGNVQRWKRQLLVTLGLLYGYTYKDLTRSFSSNKKFRHFAKAPTWCDMYLVKGFQNTINK